MPQLSMFKRFSGALLTLSALLFIATRGDAQVSAGGTPPSFQLALSGDSPTVTLPAPDLARFLAEDEAEAAAHLPWRFGAPIGVDLGLDNAGSWSQLPDGGRVWRLRIHSPGALSLNIQYDRFNLPAGAQLYLYSDDRSQLLGAFTEYNSSCSVDGSFATQPLAGDAVVLEYHEPAWVAFPGEIHLNSIVHAYRNVFGRADDDRAFGDSGSCNNNVNCPEGALWQDQKRAVAMILTSGGSRICSGALVNNTSQDLRQFFLTANHCGLSTGSYIFMFNYESPSCSNVNGPTTQSVQGCTLRATNTASDFTLVELTENIPASYNVHFAGWSAINTASTSSVGIHHPAGDIKKISFDNNASTSDRYLGNSGVVDSHWKITQWDDGTTEGGSSGSPLFDQNHRVIGQLHGGYASCTSLTADWYGKFSMSWNYGGNSASRLMDWLDPLGSNPGTFDGINDAAPVNPLLALSGVSVVDGNDSALDPGESPTLVITLGNSGAAASSITGVLSETSPYITVTDANGAWPDIAMGGSAASSNSFAVSVDPSTPVGHVVSFSLVVNAAGGYSTTLNFTLTSGLTVESFETGNFGAFNWSQSGNLPWTVVTDQAYTGTRSAKSGAVDHNQSSTMTLALQVATSGTLSFAYKVSSEANYDYLRFYIDGVQQAQWSGELSWAVASYPVSAGAHSFTWTYSKDGSVVGGSDCAWVDEIVMPELGQPSYPDIAVAPASLSRTLAPGQTDSAPLTISNTGLAALNWSATATTATRQSVIPFLKLAKGEADPRFGSFDRNAGGPDAFGYSWKDSNEPGGPVYSWADISGTGTSVAWASGDADDGLSAALPLGFAFNYYGSAFTAVKVCTNGFLSFTTASTAYTNQGIPNSAEPNNLIAPFWDDLDARTTGTIKYLADGANQRFIVQWTGVPRYGTSTNETFQVILHADGRIIYQYSAMTGTLTSATVGTENATGSDGLQVVFNAAYIANGLAVEISAEEPWLSLAPLSGTVGVGGNGILTVTFNATGLAQGTYTGMVSITSNDPDENPVLVPVTLIVGSADTQAPVIVTTCLGDTWNDQNRPVSATITDASGVASASLHYSVNGGAQQSAAMTNSGGDLWTGSLPGVTAPASLAYHVSATDASPNANFGVSTSCSYLIQVLNPPALQITYPSAGQALLTWSAVTGASQYRIYQALEQGGIWALVATTSDTSTVVNVPNDSMRIFQARAIN